MIGRMKALERELLERNRQINLLESALEKETERLNWLENEAKVSRTGITLGYVNHAEDGQVLDKGYRLMRFHEIFETRNTLRDAIDAAMEE